MEFKIPERIWTCLGFVDARWIQAEGGNRLAYAAFKEFLMNVTDESPTSDEGHAKPYAFFLRESYDLDLECHAAAFQDLYQRYTHDHA